LRTDGDILSRRHRHRASHQSRAARRFYNSAVQDYNTAREQFPGSIIAGSFNFEPREFFDVGVEGRAALDEPPKVAF
jgi:LemA protein